MRARRLRKKFWQKWLWSTQTMSLQVDLRALPPDTEPTIGLRRAPENMVAQAVAKQIAEGVSGAFAIISSRKNSVCFSCGELGHVFIDSPEKPSLQDCQPDHQWPQRQPRFQPYLGNFQQSAGQPHGLTPNQMSRLQGLLPTIRSREMDHK